MTQRVFLGDIKSYAVPGSLEDLKGAATGHVTLPLWVYWAPGDRVFDVGTFLGAKQAYTAVLSEGTLDEVCEIVNAQRLEQVWDSLVLPLRAVELWEQRLPELVKG